MVTDEFQLTDGEKSHPLWARLKAHFQERLTAARIQNDNPALTEQETAALRGRIGCLSAIIRLGDDQPLIDESRPAKF